MAGSSTSTDRGSTAPETVPARADVRERLDRVVDPELDRSIVELDYVDWIEIDDGAVEVAFTLPTAWCSPAFAWMMASDARDEIEDLPDTDSVTIRLQDHMHEEGITQGVNERKSFESTFPDADGGVREVRAMLDEKARFARQHDAVAACLDAGLEPEQIVELRRRDVDLGAEQAVISIRDIHVVVNGDVIEEYLKRARASNQVTGEDDRLFLTADGDPIPLDRFDIIQKRTRLVGVNMDGQGAVCDALNESRRAKLDRS